ncbi:MAG TPA: tRNA uridine-5-carboxymethylaminomethyl(34) synthesis GTPase MnmE [Gemmatimonadaceae bacterium]|nr:tRNA uridine-5-carboxymethylaminomethyl(34) synthesis GTPase MnmE [Gemmatimonadaceae bacterium]
MSAMLPGAEDTIAALATPPGRSALAVIRLSGPRAHEIASRLLDPWRSTPRASYRARLTDPLTGRVIERPVVTVYRAPRSYTGDDLVELSVHGGRVGPARTLGVLLSAGARLALPGEFTRRALAAGKLDVLQAEAIGDLIDAESQVMHDAALAQLDGQLSRRVEELREAVLRLEAMIAYDIDFPEEDSGPIAPARVDEATAALVESLDRLLGTASAGEVVRRGARVVLAGAPNVGKSSLFNALVGRERAIVTAIAGTTRDAIEAVIDVGAWPVRLVDTAGLRESADPIEQLGVAMTARALAEADVVLACGDSGSSLGEAVAAIAARTAAPVVPVRTKSDLSPANGELVANRYESQAATPIVLSAATGAGIADLRARLERMVEGQVGDEWRDTPLLTRERHRAAIALARSELSAFQDAWSDGDHAVPVVIAAVHLRAAATALESLIGAIDVEDVLDRVFRTFCVGK